MGPSASPSAWRTANVARWAGERPDLPVLLAHGRSDELVPPAWSEQLAHELRRGGHDVQLTLVDGAGHREIYDADVIGRTVIDWLRLQVPVTR